MVIICEASAALGSAKSSPRPPGKQHIHKHPTGMGEETTHICCLRNCRTHLIFWHHQEGWKFWSTALGAKLCFPGRCHTYGTQFNAPVCPKAAQFLAIYKMKMLIMTYPTHSDCCNRAAETQKSLSSCVYPLCLQNRERKYLFFCKDEGSPHTCCTLSSSGCSKNDGHSLVLSICSVIRGIWMPKHYFNLQMRGCKILQNESVRMERTEKSLWNSALHTKVQTAEERHNWEPLPLFYYQWW